MTSHSRTPSPPGSLEPSAEGIERQTFGLRDEGGA